MLTVCVIIGIGILLIEIVLWQVFRRKMEGIRFPNAADHSHFRFFSMTRMRLIAIFHTVFLLAVLVISTLFLW